MAGRPKGIPKTGGRQKGTKDKRVVAKMLKIAEYCALHNFDPLHALIDIARDPNTLLPFRMDAAKAVAPYLHPKLSALVLDLGTPTQTLIQAILRPPDADDHG